MDAARGARRARSTRCVPAVRRFLEKPSHPVADGLWRSGGLWNTFISSGPARLFWNLARHHLPGHTERLERYAAAIDGGDEAEALHAAYDGMAPANFSRSVLSNADELAVLPVADSGWCDWGSPQRVFASLAGTACHARLVARIHGGLAQAGAVS